MYEFHTAKIILESDDQSELIHVNVDQLSLCYPEFAPKTTLDFSKIKRRSRANRRRSPGEVQLASLSPFRHSTLLKGIILRNREEKQFEVQSVPKIIVTSICMMRSVHNKDENFTLPGEESPRMEQREAEMSQQPQRSGGPEPPDGQEPALPVLAEAETAAILR
ncbi:MAG: hypothetical protein GY816_11405, partial [Cytophagales bacterium]|nr:hypothetical protein [Cytophagales bacterium]